MRHPSSGWFTGARNGVRSAGWSAIPRRGTTIVRLDGRQWGPHDEVSCTGWCRQWARRMKVRVPSRPDPVRSEGDLRFAGTHRRLEGCRFVMVRTLAGCRRRLVSDGWRLAGVSTECLSVGLSFCDALSLAGTSQPSGGPPPRTGKSLETSGPCNGLSSPAVGHRGSEPQGPTPFGTDRQGCRRSERNQSYESPRGGNRISRLARVLPLFILNEAILPTRVETNAYVDASKPLVAPHHTPYSIRCTPSYSSNERLRSSPKNCMWTRARPSRSSRWMSR